MELARARVQAMEVSQGAKDEEIGQLHTQIEELMADLEQCSSLLAEAKEKEEEYELGISQQYQEMVEAQRMSGGGRGGGRGERKVSGWGLRFDVEGPGLVKSECASSKFGRVWSQAYLSTLILYRSDLVMLKHNVVSL